MKILALEKDIPGISDEQFGPHLKAEARRVWELQQAGILREIYFTQDTQSAVLILECADAAEATIVLKTLPLVQHGLIQFEVHPMVPYPGFSRLFEAAGQGARN
jgi:hypothetical protein